MKPTRTFVLSVVYATCLVLASHNHHVHERRQFLFGDEDPPFSSTSSGFMIRPTASHTTSHNNPLTSLFPFFSSTTTTASLPTSTSSQSLITSTNQQGSTITLTQTIVASDAPITTPTPTPTPTSSSSSGGSSSTGIIIGASVGGGVLLLAAVAFFMIKFGGRRFSGYEDNDTDIKWPELKTDPDSAVMHPLPARRTGGAGFDMGDDSDNGHEGSIKGRDSFAASTTALNVSGAVGYPAQDAHYGAALDPAYMHQPMDPNQYYDVYQQGSMAGYHPNAQAYPQDSFAESSHYGADAYGAPTAQHVNVPNGQYHM